MASACVKILDAEEKDADAKYAKVFKVMAKTEEELFSRITSLESSEKAEKDCIERL